MLNRSRSRYNGRNLPATFLQEMAFYGATDAWDFTNDIYMRGGVLAPSGITFTRASVGSYLNSNNTMTVFSSGQPRIGDKGFLIEGSRQNLFLNSAIGATQSITVTAAAHTLSFFGTGTVTLSGVSTAGPLVGTGEFNRVSLTFTPTAGSLTLTVSGDIKWVNLEIGSSPSSWIPSDGTSVTRAADQVTATLSALASGYTIFAEWANSQNGSARIIDFGGSTLIRRGSGIVLTYNGAGLEGQSVATFASGKAAIAIDASAVRGAANGSSVTVATGSYSSSSQTALRFGSTGTSNHLDGHLIGVSVLNNALTQAQLQEVTT